MITKICTKCKKEKPFDGFYKRKDRKRGRLSRCKECVKKQRRKERLTVESKINRRRRHLQETYDMTPKDWDKMYNEQQGCCGICGKHQSELKETLEIDHEHWDSERVRGLCCKHCNIRLGQYESGTKWYKENKMKIDSYLKI